MDAAAPDAAQAALRTAEAPPVHPAAAHEEVNRRRTHRAWWWGGGAAAALCAAVVFWALPPRVPVAIVVQRDFAQTVVASGHVEAPHRVSIAAQIVSNVLDVPVAEGQTVAVGQLLVVLDARELQAAADQADLVVEQARLKVRSIEEVQRPVAEQALRQAQASLDNAHAARQRAADLFRQNFIGQAALDDAQKAFELADAQVHSAAKQLDALRVGGSDERYAQAALAQARAGADAAQARLRYTRIAAPAAGVLIARDVEPGDVAQPGKALMTLSPLGATELVVQIDERNLGRIAIGQKAQASADAFPDRRFPAEVSYINPGIDAQRGSVEVKLRVPAPPDMLKQDMTVSVDIEVARRAQAVLVPVDALHDAERDPWVLRVEDGVAQRRSVRLGLVGNGVAEVLAGLAAGDRVIPVSAHVEPGERVRSVERA